MKKTKLLFAMLVIIFFGCKKDDVEPPPAKPVFLNFQNLSHATDPNLGLEYVVDAYSELIDPNTGTYFPAEGHTNVKYKGKIVKTFGWIQYNSAGAYSQLVFWAKTEINDKTIYIFTGNESPFDINSEIYVIEDDIFKVAPMLVNDSIIGIVPHQTKYAFLELDKKLIHIRCNPNSGLATYFIKEATGIFKY